MGAPECGLLKVHTFHSFTKAVEKTCSGETACGERTHTPHPMTVEVEEWCEGICEWCSRLGPLANHGDGAHR